MNKGRKIIRLLMPDIIVWAFLLLLPLYFTPVPEHKGFGNLPLVRLLPYVLSSILIIFIYYFNYHVVVPRFYISRRYFWFILITIGFLWLLTFVTEVDHLFEDHQAIRPPSPGGRPNSGILKKMIHFNQFELMILAMGIMVMTVSTFLRVTRRLREAEEEKASAELSYLKAQINPHFLFNTLNSIYSLAYKKSDQTAPAIVKLSGLMRYVITEAQEDQVLLSTEMEYLSNYVELQRLRLASSTNLKFAVKGDPEDKLISPLIFLPFIENAFKYGVNPEKHSDIKIDFVITSNSVHMEVVNSVVNTDEISSERIGVGNSKERLERMYPGSYLLNIRPGEETFSVSLHIHFQ